MSPSLQVIALFVQIPASQASLVQRLWSSHCAFDVQPTADPHGPGPAPHVPGIAHRMIQIPVAALHVLTKHSGGFAKSDGSTHSTGEVSHSSVSGLHTANIQRSPVLQSLGGWGRHSPKAQYPTPRRCPTLGSMS